MKQIYKYLFAALLILPLLCGAQTPARQLSYSLNGSLAEDMGRGPALSAVDSGAFRRDTLPCTGQIRQSYRFGDNSGLLFDNGLAGNFIRKSYTIELFFKMEDLGRYDRVIDFKDRTTDKGCYIYYGALNFYNIATSDTVPFASNHYQYYVITRDSATQLVRVYSSGRSRISFIDTDTNATLNSANKLRFFQDDLVVQNEASPGSIARLTLFDQALDSNAIFSRFTNLCAVLGVHKGAIDGAVDVYPNPTHGDA